MARTRQYSAEQIITALKESRGMVYVAARRMGCHPDTIYTRAKDDPAISQAIQAERGLFLDTAELALMKAVTNGEAWAVCFALKTQGKNRGYVERHELNLRNATDSELTQFVAGELARWADGNGAAAAAFATAANPTEPGADVR